MGAVSAVTNFVSDVVGTVVDTAVNIVDNAVKDPIGTIAKVTTAVVAPEFLPLVSAADTAIQGGSPTDILTSAGTSYLGGQAGSLVAPEVAAVTDSPLAGQLAGSAVSGATGSLLRGGDPISGAVAGLTGSAIGSGANALQGGLTTADLGTVDQNVPTTTYEPTASADTGVTSDVTPTPLVPVTTDPFADTVVQEDTVSPVSTHLIGDLGTSGLTALDTTQTSDITPTDLVPITQTPTVVSPIDTTETSPLGTGGITPLDTTNLSGLSSADLAGTGGTDYTAVNAALQAGAGQSGTDISSMLQTGGTDASTPEGEGSTSTGGAQDLNQTVTSDAVKASDIIKALSGGLSTTGTTSKTGTTGTTGGLSSVSPYLYQSGIANLTPGVTGGKGDVELIGLPKFSTGGTSSSSYTPISYGVQDLNNPNASYSPFSAPTAGSLKPGITGGKAGVKLTGLPGYLIHVAQGGSIDEHNPQFYSEGGLGSIKHQYVKGQGDGTSDSVPAMLANGEFVLPADVVSSLGNGSNDAGATILNEFMRVIRTHKQKHDAKKLPPNSKGPLAYLLQAKKSVGNK